MTSINGKPEINDKFDEIAYAQDVYRSLLDCMARPGKIRRINPADCGLNRSFNNYVQGLAITLLDQEVVFHIFEDISSFSGQLRTYTQSRPGSMENCDYFIVDGEKNFDIHRLKRGSLKFPDESATVICQAKELISAATTKSGVIKIQLQGPGIQSRQTLYVDGLNKEMMNPWRDCNDEFPLGLDWILVDSSGKLSCIPRSTELEWEVT